jgi:hypothetical protein
MISIERYARERETAWNDFISRSKNGTFLIHRHYMDYHSDRFTDHSLMIYDDGALVALFPANIVNDALFSHQGLTYGGFITGRHMRASMMLEVFDALGNYAREFGIKTIHYKAIPHIYHSYPAEEDLYALFRVGAMLARTDISTSIPLHARWPLHQGKKAGVNRAGKTGMVVQPGTDYGHFFSLVESRLLERYNTTPVHHAAEMELLASRFPDNIKLLGAYLDGRMLAATILYATPQVIHTQYITSTPEGREKRAVDYLIANVLDTHAGGHAYFDFGISTEQGGKILNNNLAGQKEEFGGRGIVHQTFIWNIP